MDYIIFRPYQAVSSLALMQTDHDVIDSSFPFQLIVYPVETTLSSDPLSVNMLCLTLMLKVNILTLLMFFLKKHDFPIYLSSYTFHSLMLCCVLRWCECNLFSTGLLRSTYQSCWIIIHFVRERTAFSHICVVYVLLAHQFAYMFSKDLPYTYF